MYKYAAEQLDDLGPLMASVARDQLDWDRVNFGLAPNIQGSPKTILTYQNGLVLRQIEPGRIFATRFESRIFGVKDDRSLVMKYQVNRMTRMFIRFLGNSGCLKLSRIWNNACVYYVSPPTKFTELFSIKTEFDADIDFLRPCIA